MIFSKLCGLMLIANITVAEKDGIQWNYLISTNNIPGMVCPNTDETVMGTTDISFHSKTDLQLKEKSKRWFKVWADCFLIYRWDEGYQKYFRKWACDATAVKVDPDE